MMRIFTEQTLKEYSQKHPEALTALQDWKQKVKKSDWTCFADVKKTFNSVYNTNNSNSRNVLYIGYVDAVTGLKFMIIEDDPYVDSVGNQRYVFNVKGNINEQV